MRSTASRSIPLFKTGYGFITKPDGQILYHKDIEAGTNLSSVDGTLANVASYLSDSSAEKTAYEYSYQGVNKLLVSNLLHNGMVLILTAPRSEIFAEAYSLLRIILGAIILPILVSAIVGFLVGNGLARPIHALTDDIKNISSQTNLLALNASIEAARAIVRMRISLSR